MKKIVDRFAQTIKQNPTASRWWLGGLGGAVTAPLIVMAMPVWLPAGAAGLDNIAWPSVLAPFVSAVMIVYACMEENLPRCALTNVALSALCMACAAAALTGRL